jgi:hypothetical protein
MPGLFVHGISSGAWPGDALHLDYDIVTRPALVETSSMRRPRRAYSPKNPHGDMIDSWRHDRFMATRSTRNATIAPCPL